MSEKVFGLEGDEYWTSPKKNVAQVLSARVMGRKHDLLIDAPELVPLETRETFPVLMYYGGSKALLRRMPVEEFGMVASVNLVDNKVWADKALFRQGPKRQPEGEPEPGCTGQDYPLDLFKVVPVEPATWITTALLWDKVSNRVRTVVGNDPAGFKDAEVEKFLAAQRGAVPPKDLQPQGGDALLVSRGPGEGVPAVPAEVGISLSADRVVVNRAGEKGRVRLSFRLPIFKTDVVPPPAKPPASDAPPVKGVAVVTLLLTGSKNKAPLLYPLHLPTYDALGGDAEHPIATGQVTLDLLSDPAVRSKPQTYWIYAFSGEVMVGPFPFAVVDEEELPPSRSK